MPRPGLHPAQECTQCQGCWICQVRLFSVKTIWSSFGAINQLNVTISGATDWQPTISSRSPSQCPESSQHSFRFNLLQYFCTKLALAAKFKRSPRKDLNTRKDEISGRSVSSNASSLAILLFWSSLACWRTRRSTLGTNKRQVTKTIFFG